MRDYLRTHLVEFDERNVRLDSSARKELEALGDGLTVPLVLYDDLRVIGFDPDTLDLVIDAYRKKHG